MDNVFPAIFRLLAQGYSFPNEKNTTGSFFQAVKELADSLGLEVPSNFPKSNDKNSLKEAYTMLFINEPRGDWAPPYASVYLSGQGLLMQQARDQARAFYDEAGLEPVDNREPEDYLPTELLFLAHLIERQEIGILARFLDEHLLKWFQHFERRVKGLDPHPYYLLLTEMTGTLLNLLREEVLNETT